VGFFIKWRSRKGCGVDGKGAGAKAPDGIHVAADASLEAAVELFHPMAEAGKDDEFTRGGLMVMSAQTNSVGMGPDMLLVPIASACNTISQIAIGTVMSGSSF
jgi:hypothetical protein